jgi:hypothetical protein
VLRKQPRQRLERDSLIEESITGGGRCISGDDVACAERDVIACLLVKREKIHRRGNLACCNLRNDVV